MDGLAEEAAINFTKKMIETCYTLEPPFSYPYTQDHVPFTDPESEVYLLGKRFTSDDGVMAVKEYVRSRLWFTYRKNFAPIGGTGPSSDQGWGCMLRCAQMLLAETLIRRHIGNHREWNREKPSGDYEKILRMFLDEKSCLYSIHQIAQMGVSEKKNVGEWFGPNTAAQVLKKLAVFDKWSNIAVHVALDNILISEDVNTIATMATREAVKIIGADACMDQTHLSILDDDDDDFAVVTEWRPLLILVPLRLGLTTINPCYLKAIQEFFKLESCVGIIGGRPNHALYFLGFENDKLLYLDPHYCRPSLTNNDNGVLEFKDKEQIEVALEATESIITAPDRTTKKILDDSTYHCDMMLSMSYDQVDPSLALAFFCPTAESFKELTEELKTKIFPASTPALFEQLEKRPKYWPPFEPYTGVKTKLELNEFHDMCSGNYEIDDGFEVLEEDNSFSPPPTTTSNTGETIDIPDASIINMPYDGCVSPDDHNFSIIPNNVSSEDTSIVGSPADPTMSIIYNN